ncbi:MAG: tRNA lysidine(34) synthetase TilS [Ilumatobacteraceae bacterium]|nr:tRNA lysidine(34) synthetase TilS [Ilumatobacteraceae bacterium]
MPETVELLDRCTFPEPGTTVTCALSGGADSTALVFLAVATRCVVNAVHIHHGLRSSADDDAECARRTAERLDIPYRIVHVDLEDGPNLEARARAARRTVLPNDVLTGHTADDQAETLLLALLRGSGAKGLAAIRPGPQHPILALRAAETRELCAREGLEYSTDPTNSDPRFRRNRVRHELIPLLNAIAEREVTPLLTRTAGILRDDDDFLDALATQLSPKNASELSNAPRPVAARAVRRWLTQDGYPPDSAAIARVLDVAAGRIAACELSGGRRVERRRGELHLFGG